MGRGAEWVNKTKTYSARQSILEVSLHNDMYIPPLLLGKESDPKTNKHAKNVRSFEKVYKAALKTKET